MKTTKEILMGAQALLQKGWCQKTLARDDAGQVTYYAGPDAVTFCMAGALFRAAYPEENEQNVIDAQRCLAKTISHDLVGDEMAMLSVVNDADTTTQEQVLGWVKKAIQEWEPA